jgi:biotin/lipoate A/B protein ligase family protein
MAVTAVPSQTPGLDLPPAYRLVALREQADAFAHAIRVASAEGAGTFAWVRRFDVLEFAVVLEPEEPLASARRAVFAGMNAMADALSSFAPPDKPVAFAWPTTLLFDGARIGGGRLAWPDACAEDAVPDWLVFGGMILAAPVGIADTGQYPAVTWLQEEGFEAEDHPAIVESFSRHLMVAFDAWGERGFKAVADPFLARLPRDGSTRRGIDGNGDLLLHGDEGATRAALLPPLREASWFDPATGLPRLLS